MEKGYFRWLYHTADYCGRPITIRRYTTDCYGFLLLKPCFINYYGASTPMQFRWQNGYKTHGLCDGSTQPDWGVRTTYMIKAIDSLAFSRMTAFGRLILRAPQMGGNYCSTPPASGRNWRGVFSVGYPTEVVSLNPRSVTSTLTWGETALCWLNKILRTQELQATHIGGRGSDHETRTPHSYGSFYTTW